jgi:hypothetical protein
MPRPYRRPQAGLSDDTQLLPFRPATALAHDTVTGGPSVGHDRTLHFGDATRPACLCRTSGHDHYECGGDPTAPEHQSHHTSAQREAPAPGCSTSRRRSIAIAVRGAARDAPGQPRAGGPEGARVEAAFGDGQDGDTARGRTIKSRRFGRVWCTASCGALPSAGRRRLTESWPGRLEVARDSI